MTEDRLARMYRQMLEDLEKLGQKGTASFQEEMQGWVNDLLKDALDPRKMMHFIRSMGIDMSQFSQMFGRMAQAGTMPQGFDPYVILNLDRSASDEEVKHRYRELVNILHQDKSKTPGTNFLFRIVVAAYNLIEKERGGSDG